MVFNNIKNMVVCRRNIIICLLILLMTFIGSCTTPQPPRNPDNICKIFKQNPKWRRSAYKVAKKWHIPVAVQMAIMHQESHFRAKSKPSRRKLLWVIPWTRPSSAYGYSQVLDSTWKRYKDRSGSWFSSRSSFSDADDFIGWYANQAHIRAGISRSDAYALYLSYHEGIGGYQRKTYLRKPWLMQVARKVERRAQMYNTQFQKC